MKQPLIKLIEIREYLELAAIVSKHGLFANQSELLLWTSTPGLLASPQ